MRKPLLALSLVVSTGLGAVPVAEAFAATPTHATTTQSSYSTATGSSTNRATNSAPTYSPQTTTVRGSNSVTGAAIISTALKYLGYPYTATGNSPSTGFSCIGFVSFVYRSNGIPLPGNLQDALAYAPQVPFSDLQPGDILYFQNTVWAGLSHAAIYLGGGKFVHAEYYGYGVRVSSFNNDSKDYNYWIGKYLGANRPWGGAAVGAVAVPPAPAPPNAGVNTAPSTSVSKSVATGPTALVAVSSLNVRTATSKSSVVQAVIQQGTSVTIVGHKNGWYKVQLADGTVGWVVAAGLGLGSTPATAAATTVQPVPVAPTVGNPTAPARQGVTTKARKVTVASHVSGLRVHSGPSLSAPVVNAVKQGQRMQVIARRSGWVKVRLSDGSVGWVSAAYAPVKTPAASASTRIATSPAKTTRTVSMATTRTLAGGRTALVATNVRTGPSLQNGVATTLMPGASYRVLGSAGGWMHVQLATGQTGWISTTVASRKPAAAAPVYKQVAYSGTHKRVTASNRQSTSVVTAGVRVHSSPSIKAPVVTVAAPGTHVTVLGHNGGWTLVRLPSGQTGYIAGSYVG